VTPVTIRRQKKSGWSFRNEALVSVYTLAPSDGIVGPAYKQAAMPKSTSAKKTNPAKWKRIVSSVKAGSKGGRPGQWSARKAQLATKRYKSSGGGYRGKKKASNSLSKWTKQKWDYAGKKGNSRYLPKSVRKNLTPAQKRLTNARKRRANRSGRQDAEYSKTIARKVRNAK